MVTLEQARSSLSSASLVRDVRELRSGHILLETVFRYPDGTAIEVFVRPRSVLHEVELTDLGQTTAWLLNLRVKPWLSRKRRALLEDAISCYGVRQDGGELVLDLDPAASLVDGVVRLSQACLRTADLTFTRRTGVQNDFGESVEELLSDCSLPYESNAGVVGRYGKLVTVDFRISGARTKSLVMTMATNTPTAAHARANELLRTWYDLESPDIVDQRLTVYDDRSTAYRDDDLRRLEDFSTVIPFSDQSVLRAIVAA